MLEAVQLFLGEYQEDLRSRELLKITTHFISNLLILPSTWEEVIDRLKRFEIVDRVRPLLEWLPIQQKETSETSLPNLTSQREILKNFAQKLLVAEYHFYST